MSFCPSQQARATLPDQSWQCNSLLSKRHLGKGGCGHPDLVLSKVPTSTFILHKHTEGGVTFEPDGTYLEMHVYLCDLHKGSH